MVIPPQGSLARLLWRPMSSMLQHVQSGKVQDLPSSPQFWKLLTWTLVQLRVFFERKYASYSKALKRV